MAELPFALEGKSAGKVEPLEPEKALNRSSQPVVYSQGQARVRAVILFLP
jgi:hypothetical protein